MKRSALLFTLILLFAFQLKAESPCPVRGLCIAAPSPGKVDEFIDFIDNEMAPVGTNLLILRVEWGYEYKSRPELVGNNPLSKRDVKKLVKVWND